MSGQEPEAFRPGGRIIDVGGDQPEIIEPGQRQPSGYIGQGRIFVTRTSGWGCLIPILILILLLICACMTGWVLIDQAF